MGLHDENEASSGKARQPFSKNVNLPFYDDNQLEIETIKDRSWHSGITSTVVPYVRAVRLQAVGVTNSVVRFNENVASKYNTGKAHTSGVVDFFRDEPALWQRCGIVAVAGLTGFISGYRRSGFIKTRNMLLSVGVAATICWPQQTVEATTLSYNYVKEPVAKLWREYSPGSPYWPKTTAVVPPTSYYSGKTTVEQDLGQSKEEDKDMYSTRGS